jgi:hypothetical protein
MATECGISRDLQAQRDLRWLWRFTIFCGYPSTAQPIWLLKGLCDRSKILKPLSINQCWCFYRISISPRPYRIVNGGIFQFRYHNQGQPYMREYPKAAWQYYRHKVSPNGYANDLKLEQIGSRFAWILECNCLMRGNHRSEIFQFWERQPIQHSTLCCYDKFPRIWMQCIRYFYPETLKYLE